MKDRLRKCTTYEIKWHLRKQAGETSKELVQNQRRKERIVEAEKESVLFNMLFKASCILFEMEENSILYDETHRVSSVSTWNGHLINKTQMQSPATGHARPLPVPCCHPDRRPSLWWQEDTHFQPGNMSALLLGSSTFSSVPLLTLYSVALSFLSMSCSSGSAWLSLAGLSLWCSSWWLFFVCLSAFFWSGLSNMFSIHFGAIGNFLS